VVGGDDKFSPAVTTKTATADATNNPPPPRLRPVAFLLFSYFGGGAVGEGAPDDFRKFEKLPH
ncbi:hypothetical protein GWI33_023422, partial [Rhynchophorus ferrugineus]